MMNGQLRHPLLDDILHTVPRRYRLPAMAAAPGQTHPTTTLAAAIEQARTAMARNEAPDPALKRAFIEALARLIEDAMRAESGDPAFQAMVLRYQAAPVREYASLSAQHARKDRRRVCAAVNAIAHPAKQPRFPPGQQREALTRLHAATTAAAWSTLSDIIGQLLDMPETTKESSLERSLTSLRDSAALKRLQRLERLERDEQVKEYLQLMERHAPRSSEEARTQATASRQRGAAVETLTTRALKALARRLNLAENSEEAYRVVTSMRVPPTIPASHQHAKTEWDAVLLKRVDTAKAASAWDVCLFVEAKASVAAASTDLPRLLRGLRLLSHAEENAVYAFDTQQGPVHLRGVSLSTLSTDDSCLEKRVLYCCDAPAEPAPRLLNAASRMQLLSAPASLEFAAALADKQPVAPQILEPLWEQLLEAPRWKAVRHQYPTLRQGRELMVHPADLLATIKATMENDVPET